MKPPLAFLAAFSVTCSVIQAGITLEGHIETTGGPAFLLKNDEAKLSGWRAIGETFDGYAIVGFDSVRRTLTVQKNGVTEVLLPSKNILVSDLTRGRVAKEFSETARIPAVEASFDGKLFFIVQPGPAALTDFQKLVSEKPSEAASLFVRAPSGYGRGLALRLRELAKVCEGFKFQVPHMRVIESNTEWSIIEMTASPRTR